MLTNDYKLPPQRLGNLIDAEKRVDFVRANDLAGIQKISAFSRDPDDIPQASSTSTNSTDALEFREIFGNSSKKSEKTVKKEEITIDSDDEIQILEDVKKETSTSSSIPPEVPIRDVNQYLKAAKDGNLAEIQKFLKKFGKNCVDCVDFYGWTATMCAAAEGNFEIFRFLMENGADPGVRDTRGMGILDIAREKRQKNFVDMVFEYYFQKNLPSTSAAPIEMTYCECCDKCIPEDTVTDHLSSITHQLNDEKGPQGAAVQSGIQLGPSNIGYRLMCASGWTEQQGLGKNSDGHRFPIRTILKRNRTGLGLEQPPKKVTHFGAFDKNAVKNERKTVKPTTKMDILKKKRKEDRIAKKFRAEFSEKDNVYEYFQGKS